MRARPGTTKKILKTIARVGSVTILLSSSPYASSMIAKALFRHSSKTIYKKYLRHITRARSRRLIKITPDGQGRATVELSHLGKRLVRRYDLDDMQLQKPLKWDKNWHILIYDLPQSFSKASKAMSKKLHELGLFRLQKSVWISPYKFLAELEFICSVFELPMEKHFYYFESKTPPILGKLKIFFNLNS